MFTNEEKKELIRLLAKVKEDGGYWPDEDTMAAAHGSVSFWATELIILRNEGKEILLAIYDGGATKFRGRWHVPGGYNRAHESIQETCSRIAKLEILGDVRAIKVLGAMKWEAGEHPYGRPLSVPVRCEPVEPIKESDVLRFFPLADLPKDLMEPHLRFIQQFVLPATGQRT